MDNKNEITTPEQAYVFGLLWADGYLGYNYKRKTAYSVCLRLQKEDFLIIKNTLITSNIGNWKFYTHRSKSDKPSWKPTLQADIHNKSLCDRLIELDFDKKSYIKPEKILMLIPSNLQKFWWRGYFDGDGCFYIKKDGRGAISLSSSYNQDWSHVEELCRNINIQKYRILRYVSKKGHKSSGIIVERVSDRLLLGSYLYTNFENEKIGLTRKYQKFTQMQNMYASSPKIMLTNKYKGVYLKSPNGELVDIGDVKTFKDRCGISQEGVEALIRKTAIQWNGWVLPNTTDDHLVQHKLMQYDKISKSYAVMKDDKKIIINNLAKYCRENNLNYKKLYKTIRGETKKDYIGFSKLIV